MKVYVVLEVVEYENHTSKVFLNEEDAKKYEMLIENGGRSAWTEEHEVEENLVIETVNVLKVYAHKNLKAEAYTFELEVVESPIPEEEHEVCCTVMAGISRWRDNSKQIRMEISRVVDTELKIEEIESIYRKSIEEILNKVEEEADHYFIKEFDQSVTEFEDKLRSIVL